MSESDENSRIKKLPKWQHTSEIASYININKANKVAAKTKTIAQGKTNDYFRFEPLGSCC